jgi:hypothetical protein
MERVTRVIISLTALALRVLVVRPKLSRTPKWEREALRRLSLFDMNIDDPMKGLQTYRRGGSRRWKSASHAETPSRKVSTAVIAQNVRRWETVESGRRWNEGRGASQRRGHY